MHHAPFMVGNTWWEWQGERDRERERERERERIISLPFLYHTTFFSLVNVEYASFYQFQRHLPPRNILRSLFMDWEKIQVTVFFLISAQSTFEIQLKSKLLFTAICLYFPEKLCLFFKFIVIDNYKKKGGAHWGEDALGRIRWLISKRIVAHNKGRRMRGNASYS